MTEKKKNPAAPQMPKAETQRGGLGRGLGALIPTGPSKPRLGAGAADVILGAGHSSPLARQRLAAPRSRHRMAPPLPDRRPSRAAARHPEPTLLPRQVSVTVTFLSWGPVRV